MSNDKEPSVAELQAKIRELEETLDYVKQQTSTYYSSKNAIVHLAHPDVPKVVPEKGYNPEHIKEFVRQEMELDFKPRLNTSSYVNVVQEPNELEVAMMGLSVNLADASVYPASTQLHDNVVEMIARLFHAPEPDKSKGESFSGTGTVGSTEACLLAGLAHKFRWRQWYAKKHGMTKDDVVGVRPNLVISSCYQAAWEKLFRYFDVEPRYFKPSIKNFEVTGEGLAALCDDKTMACVGIMGNHYQGGYDPIRDIDAAIEKLNKEKGFQIGIHVDAASGGFIAPFQDNVPAWDFRLKNVLSISTSGHKFGDAACGTGWLIFRHRRELAEHIAISVSYLGGACDSITLNFSRPATGAYSQFYKLARFGMEGYRQRTANQMQIASTIRSALRKMEFNGQPRFEILGPDDCCLPVVAARLNPKLNLKYDDVDLQHALSESHWYVCGYKLSYENYMKDGEEDSLFTDEDQEATMFRVVVKSNLTAALANNLIKAFEEVLPFLDDLAEGYQSVTSEKSKGDAGKHHVC